MRSEKKKTVTNWETPPAFFNALNAEFGFTLDVCALPGTAKCEKFFTPEVNGLAQDWTGEVFWMNPPYGRGQDVYLWVKKAHDTAQDGGTGVCLLPASVDTKWFHDFCMKASEIRFVKDRLWFSLDGTAAKRANHGSIVVIFRPGTREMPNIGSMSNGRIRADVEAEVDPSMYINVGEPQFAVLNEGWMCRVEAWFSKTEPEGVEAW